MNYGNDPFVYFGFDIKNGDPKRIVMASCTEINSTAWDERTPEVPIQIIAKDCVNGTLMPKEKFSSRIETNYTEVNRVFQEQGYRHKLDTDEQKIPYDTDIIIYDKTKVNVLNFSRRVTSFTLSFNFCTCNKI